MHQLGGLVPPKIATPAHLVSPCNTADSSTNSSWRFFDFFLHKSGGSGEGLSPLVNFYSKLPKGPAPTSGFNGIKARFFNGKNGSSVPLWATIFGIFALGYTIDYQSESSAILNSSITTRSDMCPIVVHLSKLALRVCEVTLTCHLFSRASQESSSLDDGRRSERARWFVIHRCRLRFGL